MQARYKDLGEWGVYYSRCHEETVAGKSLDVVEQAAVVTEGGAARAQRARASGNDHCLSKKAFESSSWHNSLRSDKNIALFLD